MPRALDRLQALLHVNAGEAHGKPQWLRVNDHIITVNGRIRPDRYVINKPGHHSMSTLQSLNRSFVTCPSGVKQPALHNEQVLNHLKPHNNVSKP